MGRYIESYRGHVLSSECDLFGHMNVQFYNTCLSQAMTVMIGAVGLTASKIAEHQRGFAAVEQNSKFFSEFLVGDIIHVESGILKTSSKTVTFHHRMYDSANETLSYESTVTAAYMDLVSRKAVKLDEVVLPHIEMLQQGDVT